MKVCPKCSQVFSDDTLSFCLQDGTQLQPGESQPTVVIPTVPTVEVRPRKKNTALWVLAGLSVLLIGGAGIAGLMYYSYRLGSQSSANSNKIVNVTTTPKPAASKPAVAAATPATQPKTDSTPADTEAGSDDADEAVPISWSTGASSFNPQNGKTLRFTCPEEGQLGTVWGSDVYTADSSICTAAVHAGKITKEEGGEVTIEFRPGRSVYGATTRNGVTSYNFGEYAHSFVFK